MDCTSVSKRMVVETIRSSLPVAHMVIRRRRSPPWSTQSSPSSRTPPSFQNNRVARWVHTATLQSGRHGLSLEAGVYISRISDPGLVAKDSGFVVGDRVLRVSEKDKYFCGCLVVFLISPCSSCTCCKEFSKNYSGLQWFFSLR